MMDVESQNNNNDTVNPVIEDLFSRSNMVSDQSVPPVDVNKILAVAFSRKNITLRNAHPAGNEHALTVAAWKSSTTSAPADAKEVSPDHWVGDLREHTSALVSSSSSRIRIAPGSRPKPALHAGLNWHLKLRLWAVIGVAFAIVVFAFLPLYGSGEPYPLPSMPSGPIAQAPTTQSGGDDTDMGNGEEYGTGASNDSPGIASPSAVPQADQGGNGNVVSDPKSHPDVGHAVPGKLAPVQPAPGQPTPEERTQQTPTPTLPPGSAGVTEVTREWIVELSTQAGQESVEIDGWRKVQDKSGDLLMDKNGIYTVQEAKLSIIEGSSKPTFARCAQVQTWTTRINFTTLREDSQLCAESRGGRYAMLQVRALPSSPESNGWFIFDGRTWE